ncbi:MAG: hypothetical protein HOY71_47200 [Nonomuraea sp.]|nr:hypothetical protein [Nonomuraea sp.]
MRVQVEVRPEDDGDALRALRSALAQEDDLAGRVSLTSAGPEPGSLGALDTLLVGLGSTASVTALTGALVAWIKHRTTDTTVTIRRPDGTETELSAQRMRGMTSQELTELAERVARALDGQAPE